MIRHCTERFWKLWQTDYLNTLQQRGKWRTKRESLKISQLVLIRNSNLSPCKWELGCVIQCHSGSDGLFRTVKIAVLEYKRPIVNLCLLPIDLEVTFRQVTFRQNLKLTRIQNLLRDPRSNRAVAARLIYVSYHNINHRPFIVFVIFVDFFHAISNHRSLFKDKRRNLRFRGGRYVS